MRIRSIKPEFWRSDDITALSREHRLLFIGLWSYVDDNGVGIDDYRQIAADLFALEDDQKEVRDYVREGLATLSRALLVVRYEIAGKHFLFIRSWDRHQRIDRPSKARYPRPPEDWTPPTSTNGDSPASPQQPSRESRDTFATGAGEQGNRGTGEVPPTAAAPPPAPAPPSLVPVEAPTTAAPTTQSIVGEWIDHCRKRPPNNVIGQASKHIKAMLEEGLDPDDVRAGVQAWSAKGLHPSALPSVVNEHMNSRPRVIRPSRPTTDDKIAALQRLKNGTTGPIYALPRGEAQ